MRKSLRLLFLLIAIISMSVLVACGNDQNENDGKDGNNDSQVEENNDEATNNEDNNTDDENANEEDEADQGNTEAAEPLFRVEDQEISEGNYTDLSEHIDTLKGLDEGTIVVKFNHSGEDLMSLISLSNSDQVAEHFHVYISPSALGSENRKDDENIHIQAGSVTLDAGTTHTVAFVVSQENGYKFFLNGEEVGSDTSNPVKFFSNIDNANSAQLGRTERAEDGNPYPFTGTIEFAEVYAEPLSDETLKELTAQ